MALRLTLLAAAISIVAGSFYDLEALDIDKKPFDFASTKGQVVMVVNVATYWGKTAQNYKVGLAMAASNAESRGNGPCLGTKCCRKPWPPRWDVHFPEALVQAMRVSTPGCMHMQEFPEILGDYGGRVQIMAFPCNQFMFQEPGTNAQIKKFAESKGFTGALMDKIHVNDPAMHPVYKWLKEQSGDLSPIDWNFAKFLITPNGTVHSRYKSDVFPNQLRPVIDRILSDSKMTGDVEEA